jgi:hypothetical protein
LDFRREPFKAHARDVFNAWVEISKLGDISVQMFVIEMVDQRLARDAFKILQRQRRCAVANWRLHAWLNVIVVPMSGWIVALTEDVLVLSIAELRHMQSVSGGELKPLSQEHCIHVVSLQFDRKRRCHAPSHAIQLWQRALQRLKHIAKHTCRTRALHSESVADQRNRNVARRPVDGLDVDEITRGRVRFATTGHVQFVVGAQPVHRRGAREAVVGLRRRVGRVSADGESDCTGDSKHSGAIVG